MIRRLAVCLCGLVIFATSTLHADIVTINFDDGAGAGVEIGNFYSSLGITFEDAAWSTRFDGRPGTSSPFQLDSLSTPLFPKSINPITATFSVPVDMVSISAIDVGFNDARLDVYDQMTGGNLIGTATFEGLSSLGNTFTNADTGILTVSASAIRRIELYQPNSVFSDDGVAFDNLSFNVVPEPSSISFLSAVIALGTLRRGRRSRTN